VDRTYYELLGVPLDASDDELHARFEARKEELLTLALSSAKEKRAATQELSRVNKAYMVLSNTAKRRAYDDRLYRRALADTTLPYRLAHAFAAVFLSTPLRRVLFLAALLVGLQIVLQFWGDGRG